MRSIFFGLVAATVLVLPGCVQLGISQSESETAYTTAATASDVFLISGKATGDVAGQICLADNAAYRVLISTRNPADGVKSYAPADTAHKQLQTDGARLSPICSAALAFNTSPRRSFSEGG